MMDELKQEDSEQCSEPEEIKDPKEFSDVFVGSRYGYFEILKKAGRNKCYQQEYIVRCKSCQQIFTKTLHKIKQAEGEEVCKHTRRTTKTATAPHPCAYCGEVTTNLKYCTARCKTAAINKATKRKVKYCLVCGKPTEKNSQTLCSPECRRIHRLKTVYGIEIELDDNNNYIEKET